MSVYSVWRVTRESRILLGYAENAIIGSLLIEADREVNDEACTYEMVREEEHGEQ